MKLVNLNRLKNLNKGVYHPGDTIVFGQSEFMAIQAIVDFSEPFVATVTLNRDRVGGDANTGVTVNSNINGDYVTNGLFWGGNKIDYELTIGIVAGEIITITFDGSNITDVNDNLLADGAVVATLVNPPVAFSGDIGNFSWPVDKIIDPEPDISTEFTGADIVYSKIGVWPPGVDLDAARGVISGTPTVSAQYDLLQVRGTNWAGVADSNTFTAFVPSSLLELLIDHLGIQIIDQNAIELYGVS